MIFLRRSYLLLPFILSSVRLHAGSDVPGDSSVVVSQAFSDTTAEAVGMIPHSHSFIGQLKDDVLTQVEAPFTMSTTHFLWFGAGTLLTAGLIAADGHIDKSVRYLKRDHQWINKSSPLVTELGGTYGILGVGVFAGYSLIAGDTKGTQTSLMLTEAIMTSGLWTRVGKLLTGRERPSAAYQYSHYSAGRWAGPIQQWTDRPHRSVAAYDAFPSGHTATAFSIATVFAEQYPKNGIVPAIAYSAASIVGITRLIEHTHWASDVFVGACLGYLCGKEIVSRQGGSRNSDHVASNEPVERSSIHTRFYVSMLNEAPAIGFLMTF